MRGLLRFISLIMLLLAVVAGAMDSIQSVSSSAVVLTSFDEAWRDMSPQTLALAESFLDTYIVASVKDPVMTWVLSRPAFSVFLMLSLLFWIAGYKREPQARRLRAIDI